MNKRTFLKASQELLWTDVDQNVSFSDSSCLFPTQHIFQNWATITRTKANSILNLGWFNQGYLLLVDSNSVTFFDLTNGLRHSSVIDCFIKWVQLTSACDHSPALNHTPVSVLGHSWPTSSLFLPDQYSLFTFLRAEFFSPSVQHAKRCQ